MRTYLSISQTVIMATQRHMSYGQFAARYGLDAAEVYMRLLEVE